jgi:hypothetical protein
LTGRVVRTRRDQLFRNTACTRAGMTASVNGQNRMDLSDKLLDNGDFYDFSAVFLDDEGQ